MADAIGVGTGFALWAGIALAALWPLLAGWADGSKWTGATIQAAPAGGALRAWRALRPRVALGTWGTRWSNGAGITYGAYWPLEARLTTGAGNAMGIVRELADST